MIKKLTKKSVLRIALLLLVIIGIVVAIAQLMAQKMVFDFLARKLPQHVHLNYKNVNANVLTGTIGLKDISLEFYDRDSMILNTKVRMDALVLEGLGYWDFFFRNTINVRRLLLERPEVRHYPYRVFSKKNGESEGVVQLLKTIELKELAVKNGRLYLLQESSDSTALSVRDVNFTLDSVRTGPDRISKKIPVAYGNYELIADSLYVNLGQYEELQVSKVVWNRSQAKVKGLRLRSKYDKLALSKYLTTERDHIDLEIPKMDLDSIRFGFEKDTFFITTGTGTIRGPRLELFRDKLVSDNETKKQLYSRSIRQLPIHITVPRIEISNGNVVYSERVADVDNPGKLSFEKLNVTLSNLSNTYKIGERTAVRAETKFMGYADMTLDWSFDINRTDEAFIASGTLSNFNTESINPFLESNLRARASGSIEQLYFTVYGDAISSTGDIKMKYTDLRFEVLKKNRSGINKVLTAIGNIFVNDGSDTDAEGYRYGDIDIERDVNTSFFNYLWLSVRDGTLSTLTGNGKK